MTKQGSRPLRTLVLGRLMPATLAFGIIFWGAAAYFLHVGQVNRLQETLHQRLELRAAVAAARIEAVTSAVENAARNSITIAAMAGQDVNRIVVPYLKSITFAEANAERVALVDYRARLIVADTQEPWEPPVGWDAAFERVIDGSFESLIDEERLVLIAPVVLGSYVEGALVADIALPSLFANTNVDENSQLIASPIVSAEFDFWRTDDLWQGEVTWPIGDDRGIAVNLRKSASGAGFWDNPLQVSLAAVCMLLMCLTAMAIVNAARSVAEPVRRLVEELAHKGARDRRTGRRRARRDLGAHQSIPHGGGRCGASARARARTDRAATTIRVHGQPRVSHAAGHH